MCVECKFWFTKRNFEKKIKNALLTEQNERQVLFCTVTSRLLHDDAKIQVTLSRLYNIFRKLAGDEYCFPRIFLLSGQVTF